MHIMSKVDWYLTVHLYAWFNPFPNDEFQTLPNSEFADDNCTLDENCGKFSKWIENTARNFSFSRSVFKWLVMQTRKKQGLFGKGLTVDGVH